MIRPVIKHKPRSKKISKSNGNALKEKRKCNIEDRVM